LCWASSRAVWETTFSTLCPRKNWNNSGNQLLVSAARAWEIATKWRLGKLNQASAVVRNDPRQAGLLKVEHRDPVFTTFPDLALLR
jgi:PIN domain nuclease of toxin-antitoxin system